MVTLCSGSLPFTSIAHTAWPASWYAVSFRSATESTESANWEARILVWRISCAVTCVSWSAEAWRENVCD